MNLFEHIDLAEKELGQFVNRYCEGKYFWPEKDVKKVLALLKKEIPKKEQNPRVFAAFRDVTVISIRNYENTPLGEAISLLSKKLEIENEIYAAVGPLGKEFGKQEPI